MATVTRISLALRVAALALAIAAPVIAHPLSAVEADRGRISAHLARVERELMEKDTRHLSPELLAERRRNIARLREYRLRGELPHNTNHPGQRVPYFIDRDGRACAVGALIIASGHRELAERVSANENNARLKQMKTTGLAEWVAQSGLTVDECAKIQPSYCDESLCGQGDPPVCGQSGTSYACLRVLNDCSDDTYAYDGECVDAGPPDAGPVIVTTDDDGSDGCATRSGRAPVAPALLLAFFALVLFRHRRRR